MNHKIPVIVNSNTQLRQGQISELFSSVQGEGLWTGYRQIFLRLSGCDLRCQWCDTPDSLDYNTQTEFRVETVTGSGKFEYLPNPVSIEVLAELILKLEVQSRHHSLSFTGGEPLLQSDFLLSLIEYLKACSFKPKFYLETGGHRPDLLLRLIDLLDLISFDLKLPSSTGERHLWEKHIEFIKLATHKESYAKIVLTQTTDWKDLDYACQILKPYIDCQLVLQPVWGTSKTYNPPSNSQLIAWLDHAIDILGANRVRLMSQQHKYLGQL
ncbi:MAG: 7-carboxy-7-deazaguanine synthase QueE [Candidatus Caenarcaniphilales bacterium]|nr:7-carboxy-7-deazaguanine synthase QueE [Candidatus Caenarcaniphilales bacterium]